VKISPKLREKQCRTQRNDDNGDADNTTSMVVVVVVMTMMMINGANAVFKKKKTGTICCHWVSMCVSTNPLILFFLNNQPDAQNIQIYSVIKLYMFQASSLPIMRSSLLYIRHW
jgi:hypothetical protein